MMKKNKLYTVNKWNQPAFMPKEKNIFWPGGDLTGSLSANNPSDFWGINSAVNSPLPTTLSPQANQALGANLANSASSSVAKGIGSSLGNVGLGIAGSIGNKALKGLIGGDLESDAGNAIADIGNSVGGLVSNIPGIGTLGGMAVQLGTGAIGGLVNRAFGSKLNEENIANVKNKSGEITKQGSLSAGAQSNEDVIGNWGNADLAFNFNKDYIGKDGWFSSKAADKFDEMQRLLGTAKRSAIHGLEMGVHNADTNQDNDVASNFIYALGGPINNAIDYGFMSDYLLSKNKTAENKNQMTNMFMGMPNSMFAFGGDMQTNSADYSVGKVYDVSNEEANRLKAMGYEFEYIN